MHITEYIRLTLESILYSGQAGIYALAFNAARRGRHASCRIYLASSLIYLSLAAQPLLSLG